MRRPHVRSAALLSRRRLWRPPSPASRRTLHEQHTREQHRTGGAERKGGATKIGNVDGRPLRTTLVFNTTSNNIGCPEHFVSRRVRLTKSHAACRLSATTILCHGIAPCLLTPSSTQASWPLVKLCAPVYFLQPTLAALYSPPESHQAKVRSNHVLHSASGGGVSGGGVSGGGVSGGGVGL